MDEAFRQVPGGSLVRTIVSGSRDHRFEPQSGGTLGV